MSSSELYKQEIHLPFTGNIRFDILTEDTVRRMKEALLHHRYGIGERRP